MQSDREKLKAAGCPDDVCDGLLAKQGMQSAAATGPAWLGLVIMLAEQFGPQAWAIVKQWLQTPTP